MPTVENDGVNLYFETEGTGPRVFLQHGITYNLESWRSNNYVAHLRDDYELVLLDARGHGRSDKPHDAASYAWKSRASDVIAVADHLGEEKINFWGYSMGGKYAFSLVEYFPARINSLVIGGSSPKMFGATSNSPFRDINGADPSTFVRAFERMHGSALPEEFKRKLLANDFEAIAASLQAKPTKDSFDQLANAMTMPCFFYAGENDQFFASVQEFAGELKNSRFEVIENCNHPQTHSNSNAVLPHVKAFLHVMAAAT